MKCGPLAFLSIILLSGVGLSGCVDPKGEPDEVSGIAVDFPCESTYPDGETPLRCENELQTATAGEKTIEHGWVCVSYVPHGPPIRLYWSPTLERHAIEYEVPGQEDPVSGAFAIHGPSRVDYFMWNNWESSAFLLLPEFNQNEEVLISLFRHELEPFPGGPEIAEVRVNWTMFQDKPYPTRVAMTDEGAWYFPQITIGRPSALFPYVWPTTLVKQTPEGAVTLVYHPVAGTWFEHDTNPTLNCP